MSKKYLIAIEFYPVLWKDLYSLKKEMIDIFSFAGIVEQDEPHIESSSGTLVGTAITDNLLNINDVKEVMYRYKGTGTYIYFYNQRITTYRFKEGVLVEDSTIDLFDDEFWHQYGNRK